MSKRIHEIDCSSDYLRWINKTSELNLKTPKGLDAFQKEIIEANDSAFAYFFAFEFDYKSYLMQKVILTGQNIKYVFFFAQNINNADIKTLQSIITLSDKIEFITKFACFVKGANKKLLQKHIIRSRNVKYIHMFMKHNKNVNIKIFKDIIIKSGKPRYLFELAKSITNLEEIGQIEDLIIKSECFTYMRLFAQKIKQANVEKIENAVIALGNDEELKKFARFVKKSKMHNFLLVDN